MTKVCQNNCCFFRQRDVFGTCPFYILDEGSRKKEAKLINKLYKKYGRQTFPEFEGARLGFNCIYPDEAMEEVIDYGIKGWSVKDGALDKTYVVNCKSFVGEDDK